MPGTSLAPAGTAEVPITLFFRNDVFMRLTAAYDSDNERAAAAGISRTTLNRLRAGDIRISLHRATTMASRLGVHLSALFTEAA